MIHASVRAVGAVHGGPDEIHCAVEDAVGPGGTVMMFVGCQDGFDAEFFRSSPGTVCSEAVCGRVAARGAKAGWLVADAPWNYGFGPGSPFAKLVEARGRVLLLGSPTTR